MRQSGEQPLPKGGACCLASINLSEFVRHPYEDTAHFDIPAFKRAVAIGIKGLDEVIDENHSRHPLEIQRQVSFNYRNIGLGAFGYATMLMKLGYAYGSKEAIQITDYIFSTMFREAVITSALLAKEKGSYPNYKPCVYDSTIIKNHFSNEEIAELRECGLRNCSLLSIAPNGSLATLLGESGGCEPEFAISYTRRTVGMTDGEDTYYQVYCKAAREYLDKKKKKELPSYFISSAEIDPHNRVLTQACMQNHVDTAISSTVNLPNSATKEDIAKIYLDAWKNGLKGITIFRDGCERLGNLTTSNSNTVHSLVRGDW